MDSLQPFGEDEWYSILAASHNKVSTLNQLRLRRSMVLGIPSILRGEIWSYVSGGLHLAKQFSEDVYEKLREMSQPKEEVLIAKDIYRTYPEHDMFKQRDGPGQRSLFNLLKAYANYDPEVGYCQGMGFIAGLLLMNIPSEAQAFWTFVQIMTEKDWRSIFLYVLCSETTPKLLSLLEVLESEINKNLPDLNAFLQARELHFGMVFTQRLITLFACDGPVALAERVLDVFLYEGEYVLITLVLRMLQLKQHTLMAQSTDTLYQYLRRRLVQECYEEYGVQGLLTSPSSVL